jgi:hypothetical protein
MSEPTPKPRQYFNRRIIKTVAGALAIVATCFAIAASGTPGDASANGSGLGSPDPDIKAMNKAFQDYMKSVKNMQKEFLSAETFGLDDAHAVGAYDLITSFLNSTNRSQLTASGSGRRGYPRFAGFDDPDTRIGVDNPDTQYMGTVINNSGCEGVWRIFGNRSNTVDFILTTFDTASGTGGGPTLEDEHMVINPDGSFEAYASCPDQRDPSWDNWLELFDSEQIQIARRQSACNWSDEEPGEIHIEREGSRGVPSGPLDPAIMTEQILDGKAILDVQGPFWPAFVDTIRNNIPVNTATPWRPTGGLGITTQLNMLMWFELEDDEAMIVRFPDEDVAAYYGLQLSNFWGSSADWANRNVSQSWGLDGTCQSEKGAFPTPHPAQQLITSRGGPDCGVQTAYYMVVSKQDPGVQNWIDTAELSQGLLAARLQSVPVHAPSGVPADARQSGRPVLAELWRCNPVLPERPSRATRGSSGLRAQQVRLLVITLIQLANLDQVWDRGRVRGLTATTRCRGPRPRGVRPHRGPRRRSRQHAPLRSIR